MPDPIPDALPDAMPDAPPRLVLSLDTASTDAAVALLRDDEVVVDDAWTIATTPSEELLAAVDRTLGTAGVARSELQGIAVVIGPGGYSGLRAGVATAQGLAFGLGVPLAGVGRLPAEAARDLADTTRGAIVAVHDAGRSGVAWAAFEVDAAGEIAETSSPRLDEPDALALAAPQGRWCGDLTERVRAALAAAGRDAELPSSDTTAAARPSRAVSAARLARRGAAFGDPAIVDVVYLRPPPITRPRA